MSDNQVLALMAATIVTRSPVVERSARVEHAAREAVAIGELFGVHASEDTKLELLLGGNAFEQPVTDQEANDCVEAAL